ncbi:hypothetical protein K491DRAFT_593362 [Lophiostoma macrostomum CBS 122681]|uniref:Uncharacterized protein n=1 Tax=Lophiostoma macrostomum CBS 122681 TaxID=1314788 RepID=A0A6A6THF2_9PLEO|nr:hypothetical protein K491DRAFT_593362 [Lophiostoma macrostomum CBS 122681]
MPSTLTSAFLLSVSSAATYIAYQHYSLSRKVTCTTTPYVQNSSVVLPNPLSTNASAYIIIHELASKHVLKAELSTPVTTNQEFETVLIRFVRHTMSSFSRYPPAYILYFLTKSPYDRQTFNAEYLQSLDFKSGDRVCGVYVVSSRSNNRVTLSLDAPESYKGPNAEGMIVVEVEDRGEEVVFSNHTVMWRKKGTGERGPLESAVGRWVHGFMVRALVEGGVGAVTSGHRGVKEE